MYKHEKISVVDRKLNSLSFSFGYYYIIELQNASPSS